MIIDIIIYILATLVSWIAVILPVYSIYPENFLDGIEYVGEKVNTLDFFIFDINGIMVIFTFLLSFEVYYFTAQKIGSLINFFRGSGKLDI